MDDIASFGIADGVIQIGITELDLEHNMYNVQGQHTLMAKNGQMLIFYN